jgi:hypothetical protein
MENHQTENESADKPAISYDMEWTCHPLKRRPLAAVLVTLFIMVCGLAVYVATESRWFSAFALIVLYLSVAKFYFPTTYGVTSEGITVKTTTQKLFKPWSMYRSYYPDKNGVLLSPFTRPTRLENFRGLFVLFENNRTEVLEYLKEKINPEGGDKEPT